MKELEPALLKRLLGFVALKVVLYVGVRMITKRVARG